MSTPRPSRAQRLGRLVAVLALPALAVLLVLGGAALVVAAVYLLAGLPWALLAAGAGAIAAGLFAVPLDRAPAGGRGRA